MRSIRIIAFVLLALALTLSAFYVIPQSVNAQVVGIPTLGGTGPAAQNVPGSYIVEFKNNTVTTAPKLMREVAEDRKKFDLDVTNVYSSALKGYAIENLTGPGAAQTLIDIKRTDRDVQSISPDAIQEADIQAIPTGINRVDADKNTATAYKIDNREQKPDIDVAVIDTGVLKHSDLNVFKQVSFTDAPYTVHSDPCVRTPAISHGTNVAGLIGARDNLGGVVGMVPGARIWSLQVFTLAPDNRCLTFTSLVIAAMDYVTANAADIEVTNLSLGAFLTVNQGLTEAIAVHAAIDAGVVVVASAGNDRTNVRWGSISGNEFTQVIPCVVADVICVGAISDFDGLCGSKGNAFIPPIRKTTEFDDRDAFYTNWSQDGYVDLYAPGTNIGTTFSIQGLENRYVYATGTSFSAPIVSGAAAITLLNNPSFTPAQVLSDLQSKAYTRGLNQLGAVVCNLTDPTDSTGSGIIWIYYTNSATTPAQFCVQNTPKPAIIPDSWPNWCGLYHDEAKMLDVSPYP